MIVRCDTCQTEFAVEDSVIGDSGATVRCSVCAYVFHVAPAVELDTAAKPWQLRSPDGRLLVAQDLSQVVAWLREGVVTREAELSRSGRRWTRVADMPELAQVQLSKHSAGPARARSGPSRSGSPGGPTQGTGVDPRLTATLDAAVERAVDSALFATGEHTQAEANRGAVEGPGASVNVDKVHHVGELPNSGLPVELGDLVATRVLAPNELAASHAQEEGEGEGESEEDVPSVESIELAETQAFIAPDARPGVPPPPSSDLVAAQVEQISDDRLAAAGAADPAVEDVAGDFGEAEVQPPTAKSSRFPWRRVAVSVGYTSLAVALLVPLAALVAVKVPRSHEYVPAMAGLAARLSLTVEHERPQPPVEFADAIEASRFLGARALETEISRLRGALDRGVVGRHATADTQVALAQLLATRAMAFSMVAAVDPSRREVASGRTALDLDSARRVLEALGQGPELHRHHHFVRALTALAEGREAKVVRSLVPEWDAAGRRAVGQLIEATQAWRRPLAPVEPVLSSKTDVGGQQPSALEQSFARDSAHGLVEAGELMVSLRSSFSGRSFPERDVALSHEDALAELNRILVRTPDHIVATSIQRRMQALRARAESEAEVSDAPPPDDRTGVATRRVIGGLALGGGRAQAPRDYRKEHAKLVRRGTVQHDYAGVHDPIEQACKRVEGGDLTGAVAALRDLVATHPENLRVLSCLAMARQRTGDVAGALALYEKSLEFDSDFETGRLGAARAAAATGDDALARHHFEALLSLRPGHSAALAYLSAHPE